MMRLTALAIFAIFYFIGKYCRKLERERARAELNFPSSRLPEMHPVPPSHAEDNVNNLLEHFLFQYRSHCQHCPIDIPKDSSIDPPPLYMDALSMPKPEPGKTTKFYTLSFECEMEPTSFTKARNKVAQAPKSEDIVPSYEFATASSNLTSGNVSSSEISCRDVICEDVPSNHVMSDNVQSDQVTSDEVVPFDISDDQVAPNDVPSGDVNSGNTVHGDAIKCDETL